MGNRTNSRLWATDGELPALRLTCPAAPQSQALLRAAAPTCGGCRSKCPLGSLPMASGHHPSPPSVASTSHFTQSSGCYSSPPRTSVLGHHKGSFPCKSSPAVTVMVSVNETLLFTLAMGPLTLPSHGLQKVGVWAIGEKTGFWEFSEYGLKNSREVMVARCAFLGYAIKFPLVNVT